MGLQRDGCAGEEKEEVGADADESASEPRAATMRHIALGNGAHFVCVVVFLWRGLAAFLGR